MEKRKLGNTDLEISIIGFGAWAIGGSGWQFGWGPQHDVDSIAAIYRALDSGINWIDTAAVYGLGHSEKIVAEALSGMSERPFIFTKCALCWDENRKIYASLKADSIRKECEDSLIRLETDVIDLYQIHWPNPNDDIEEGWSTLAQLQKEGKVRYIGVSNFNVKQIKRAEKIAPVSSLQPPYSLLNRDIEKEILPYCNKQNIGTIIYSPMASGLLSGRMTREEISFLAPDDWRRLDPEFQDPRLTKNLQLVEKLTEFGNKYNVIPGVIAIAWTLKNSNVNAAIVGGRSSEQVDEFVKAAEIQLSDEDYKEINDAKDAILKY